VRTDESKSERNRHSQHDRRQQQRKQWKCDAHTGFLLEIEGGFVRVCAIAPQTGSKIFSAPSPESLTRRSAAAMVRPTRVNVVPPPSDSPSQLLLRWRNGDEQALQALIPLVYKELRQAAHRCLRAERADHTLQSTELVHEVYLRLAGDRPLPTENRAHFVAIAAKLMRQILVDYARRRAAAKRGPQYKVELDESFVLPQRQPVDVLAVDSALHRLAVRDAQQERIVELRFFGGLTVEETAAALEVSPATVKRDWNMARAWLTREMGRSVRGRDPAVGEGKGAF